MEAAKRIWVIPAEGLRIPITTEPRTYLPAEGQEVTYSMYWERLKRNGAVKILSGTDAKRAAESAATKRAAAAAKAAKEKAATKTTKTTKTQGE